tara:strand:+ start:22 stop:1119 length:1098 start_codon:yes stop_codon:yes gene_type:complete
MSKSYYSLGLMSGTSADGVDASIIQSDGDTKYEVILDKYFKYNEDIYKSIHSLKDKINNSKDLKNLSKEIQPIEREITLFHAKVVNAIIKESKLSINFLGFHGQTIFHSAKEKISKQLGDGKLLSKLTKKTVIYKFRENDLNNKGEGAPLAPIFHKLMKNKYKIKVPLVILNIGGITNATYFNTNEEMYSKDIGPGNCMIDQWIRTNSNKKYDEQGDLAKLGKINKTVLDVALKKFEDINHFRTYDVKDFDLSFVDGMSLEDGAATLTEYTLEILNKKLKKICKSSKENILISGGGRKNIFLIKKLQEKINIPLKLIDDFGINGDFVESQAFAYIAIRSYLNLPISFPETTGVAAPTTGGIIIKY